MVDPISVGCFLDFEVFVSGFHCFLGGLFLYLMPCSFDYSKYLFSSTHAPLTKSVLSFPLGSHEKLVFFTLHVLCIGFCLIHYLQVNIIFMHTLSSFSNLHNVFYFHFL